MRTALFLCCVLLVTGCRKKSAPEFYALEGQHSILVAREGDDAFLSPEMDAVVAGLQAIPPDALERPRADVLAAAIDASRQRVKADRAPLPSEAKAADPFANRTFAALQEEALPEPQASTDAGPPQPHAGMPLSKFLELFGACFTSGPASVTQDGGSATSQVVVSKGDCQSRFGVAGTSTQYLFTEKGLWGKRSEVAGIDAGPPPPKPAPKQPAVVEVPAAQVPSMIIPGAPLAEPVPAPAPRP